METAFLHSGFSHSLSLSLSLFLWIVVRFMCYRCYRTSNRFGWRVQMLSNLIDYECIVLVSYVYVCVCVCHGNGSTSFSNLKQSNSTIYTWMNILTDANHLNNCRTNTPTENQQRERRQKPKASWKCHVIVKHVGIAPPAKIHQNRFKNRIFLMDRNDSYTNCIYIMTNISGRVNFNDGNQLKVIKIDNIWLGRGVCVPI